MYKAMYYVIPNPVSLVSDTFPVLDRVDTRGNRVPLGKASAAAKGAELSATQPHGPVRQPILTSLQWTIAYIVLYIH